MNFITFTSDRLICIFFPPILLYYYNYNHYIFSLLIPLTILPYTLKYIDLYPLYDMLFYIKRSCL
ncbi:hypothetical protein BT3372_10693 [Brochothrix thermosphacta]